MFARITRITVSFVYISLLCPSSYFSSVEIGTRLKCRNSKIVTMLKQNTYTLLCRWKMTQQMMQGSRWIRYATKSRTKYICICIC